MRLIGLLLALSVTSWGSAPALFFTDMITAPNTGGETVGGFSGAYVTIYGNFMGSSQGASTITWNGIDCLRVVPATGNYSGWGTSYLWYQKLIVQLGTSCTAGIGNLVMTVGGSASNGLSLTTRATGGISFVKTTGNDSTGSGSFASPWRTILKCKDTISPGGVCYIGDGVNQTTIDAYAAVNLGTAGTAAAPLALLTYPGAASTIGHPTNIDRALEPCANLSGCANGVYWVVGGFSLTGVTWGADLQTSNIRLIGNNLQCPNVNAGTAEACLQTESSSFETILGNEITNVGAGGKLYHGMYYGADGHDFEVAWNSVHDVLGCRGMQWFNSGIDSYNISVHDNLLFNIRCDAINLATVNPDHGFVNVFNNVIYHAGIGPDPGDLSNYTCINVNSAVTSPAANVEVYNNTMYDCGSRGGATAAIMSPQINTRLRNNILYSISSEPYFFSGPSISGTNNVYFGNGNGPAATTGNVNANPGFVSTVSKDFHLALVTSPASNAGVTIGSLVADHDGLVRPQGSAYDIGAYEFEVAAALVTHSVFGKMTGTGKLIIH